MHPTMPDYQSLFALKDKAHELNRNLSTISLNAKNDLKKVSEILKPYDFLDFVNYTEIVLLEDNLLMQIFLESKQVLEFFEIENGKLTNCRDLLENCVFKKNLSDRNEIGNDDCEYLRKNRTENHMEISKNKQNMAMYNDSNNIKTKLNDNNESNDILNFETEENCQGLKNDQRNSSKINSDKNNITKILPNSDLYRLRDTRDKPESLFSSNDKSFIQNLQNIFPLCSNNTNKVNQFFVSENNNKDTNGICEPDSSDLHNGKGSNNNTSDDVLIPVDFDNSEPTETTYNLEERNYSVKSIIKPSKACSYKMKNYVTTNSLENYDQSKNFKNNHFSNLVIRETMPNTADCEDSAIQDSPVDNLKMSSDQESINNSPIRKNNINVSMLQISHTNESTHKNKALNSNFDNSYVKMSVADLQKYLQKAKSLFLHIKLQFCKRIKHEFNTKNFDGIMTDRLRFLLNFINEHTDSSLFQDTQKIYIRSRKDEIIKKQKAFEQIFKTKKGIKSPINFSKYHKFVENGKFDALHAFSKILSITKDVNQPAKLLLANQNHMDSVSRKISCDLNVSEKSTGILSNNLLELENMQLSENDEVNKMRKNKVSVSSNNSLDLSSDTSQELCENFARFTVKISDSTDATFDPDKTRKTNEFQSKKLQILRNSSLNHNTDENLHAETRIPKDYISNVSKKAAPKIQCLNRLNPPFPNESGIPDPLLHNNHDVSLQLNIIYMSIKQEIILFESMFPRSVDALFDIIKAQKKTFNVLALFILDSLKNILSIFDLTNLFMLKKFIIVKINGLDSCVNDFRYRYIVYSVFMDALDFHLLDVKDECVYDV